MQAPKPRPLERPLDLRGFEGVHPALLAWLGDELDERLATTSCLQPSLPHAPSWATHDGQSLRSGRVVDDLVASLTLTSAGALGTRPPWVLGVVALPLAAPGRPFVFGEATFNGCCAVVTTAPFSGGGEALLRQRLLKESMHELGHVAGLRHCFTERCVMNESPALGQVDAKQAGLCAECSSILQSKQSQLRS